jgi:hypothetical protein
MYVRLKLRAREKRLVRFGESFREASKDVLWCGTEGVDSEAGCQRGADGS